MPQQTTKVIAYNKANNPTDQLNLVNLLNEYKASSKPQISSPEALPSKLQQSIRLLKVLSAHENEYNAQVISLCFFW